MSLGPAVNASWEPNLLNSNKVIVMLRGLVQGESVSQIQIHNKTHKLLLIHGRCCFIRHMVCIHVGTDSHEKCEL